MATGAHYRFGPLERRGILFGLRVTQAAILLVGGLGAVGLLAAIGGLAGAAGALVVLLVAVPAALFPIGARNVDEWTVVMMSFLRDGLTGRWRWRSGAHLQGIPGGQPDPAPVPPPPVEGIEFCEISHQGRPVHMHVERGTYTVVLLCSGGRFLFEDPEDQALQADRWGTTLGSLCREGTPVEAVQWVEQTVPERNSAALQYLADELATKAADERKALESSPEFLSYFNLARGAGPQAGAHQLYVALQISDRRAGAAIRRGMGSERSAVARRRAAGAILLREVDALAADLQAMNVHVHGLLSPRSMAAVLRIGFEPASRRWVTRRGRDGLSLASAWPLRTETRWGAYRADSTWHATFWARELPRQEVTPTWLYHLLVDSSAFRTVSCVMQPLSPSQAKRATERQVTAGEADIGLKGRHGYRVGMGERTEQATAERREGELVAGHGLYRLSLYVTVSAEDLEELEEAVRRVEGKASRSMLELQRLVGEQAEAFTYTLPLGRGLS